MSPQSTRSMPLILAQAERERDAQSRYFDQLDAKAGVILGFAGIFVALAPGGALLIDLGRSASAAGGIFAVWAFWPRSYPAMDLRGFRERYLGAEPAFTELHLLDMQIAMTERAAGALRRKAHRLQIGMLLLVGATLLTAMGLALDW